MRLLTGIIVCACALSAQADLTHRYRFEGNALDSAETLDGVVFGATFQSGVVGQGMLLDGVNDYVDLGSLAVTTNTFTIATWANMYGPAGGSQPSNTLFSQRDDNTKSSGINLSPGSTTSPTFPSSTATAFIRDNNNQILRADSTFQGYGTWHHYAMTLDNSELKLYVDGQLQTTIANTLTGNLFHSIDHVVIGKQTWRGVDQMFFNGMIDELRIYDTALDASEIAALAVPEPATLLLLGVGGLVVRRRPR